MSLVYSVTKFHNWRLAHVASCQPDIGAWHRLYTSTLLWSQDSWSSFFIGTSYKDHQVWEKFTDGPRRFGCSNFTSKNVIYVVHVPVKRSKTLRNPIYLFSSLCGIRLTMVDFEPSSSLPSSVDVIEWATTTLVISMGNLDIYQKKVFFPNLQKSEEILEIRKKLKFSLSEFRKNRFDNFTKSI